MGIERYIITQGVKTKENTIIPIWDERLVFEKSEHGNIIKMKGSDFVEYFSLIECIYDLKKKKIEIGIELNVYPIENNINFKKGEEVYFESDFRTLTCSKIKDIIYVDYELVIKKGRSFDKFEKDIEKDIEINKDSLYAIKRWKPYYELENGKIIEWEHQLYHISNK